MRRLYVLGSIHPGAIVAKSSARPITVFPGCREGHLQTLGSVCYGRIDAQREKREERQWIVAVDVTAHGGDEVGWRVERVEALHFTEEFALVHGGDELVADPLVLVAIDPPAVFDADEATLAIDAEPDLEPGRLYDGAFRPRRRGGASPSHAALGDGNQ